jgi:hypothetical protein
VAAPVPRIELTTLPHGMPAAVQRLHAASSDLVELSRSAEVAPLVGVRQLSRSLDAWSVATPAQRPVRASRNPEGAELQPVQRSVPATARPGTRASDTVGAPHARAGTLPVGYIDPGQIAVASGAARRDADGSVAFDVSAAPLVSNRLAFPAARDEQSADWHTVAAAPPVLQRQEAAEPAESTAALPDGVPGSSLAPAPSVTAAPTAGAAWPAAGASGQPLDELARQLLGPLTARLKAELRLDRERAGLLTDLRL